MHTILDDGMVQVTSDEYEMAVDHFSKNESSYHCHRVERDEVWFDSINDEVVGATV